MNDGRFLKMKNQSSRTSLQPTPFVEILSFSLSLSVHARRDSPRDTFRDIPPYRPSEYPYCLV